MKVFIPEENLSHANSDNRSPVGKVNNFLKKLLTESLHKFWFNK